jgi:hypothetical protein
MLQDILAATPVRSVDDALAVMTAIDSRLPDADGVKWFNRLYLRVTESVRTAVNGPTFADASFMTELDVVFANLYFTALAAAERGDGGVPSAWSPLFQMRGRSGIRRIQFALAGMNAHINRDLPAGIVGVFETLGGDPLTGDAQRADFDSVNAILEEVETRVKAEFSLGLVHVVDTAAGQTDDQVAMWKVRAARAAAWTNAQVMWSLRRSTRLQTSFFDRLDGLTGLASRGLLIPTTSLPT